ncbi:type II toxin-antitoxin system RelE/ParE family toxin [Asticcacaulis sp.]
MRVTFSPMARNDLREIARYIAQDAPGRARTFTLELQQKALRLVS